MYTSIGQFFTSIYENVKTGATAGAKKIKKLLPRRQQTSILPVRAPIEGRKSVFTEHFGDPYSGGIAFEDGDKIDPYESRGSQLVTNENVE